MKAPIENSALAAQEEVIASQKEELRKICSQYNVTTTNIAKEAKVAASTINRFWSKDEPGHALSATTMAKVRKKFPIESLNKKPSDLNGAEAALTFISKTILKALIEKNAVNKEWLKQNFIYALDHYQDKKIPDAVLVMEQMLALLEVETHSKRAASIRQMLSLVPLGSA